MIHFKDNKNKSALSTRWAQMSKQEQIIEKKKIEIQAKMEAQKQAAALAAQAKLANPGNSSADNSSGNIFSNDGSFMSQYKALLEKQRKEKAEKEAIEKQKALEEELKKIPKKEPKEKKQEKTEEDFYRETLEQYETYHEVRQPKQERPSRERQRRWSDRGRHCGNSPVTPVMEEQNKYSANQVSPPMQHPNGPHDGEQGNSNESNHWDIPRDFNDSNDGNSNQGPMQQSMSHGPMGPGHNMGHGPDMGQGSMRHGQNMRQGGPNMPPMPPGPPMPPFMGGPPNFPMPPNFMGPNGPMPPNMPGPPGPPGPHGPPGPMPPNMSGPNGPPMPPFFGPNGPMPPFPPNPSMMGPNGPPNSVNSNMPFPPGPPFGPNGPFGPGPNFGNGNGPNFGNGTGPNFGNGGGPNFGNGNGPPMPPFMPPPGPPKTESSNDLLPLTSMPNAPNMNARNMQPNSSRVLSTDNLPPAVVRAANEVARNGEHWENVLKAVQDQNLWFLFNPNSNEYKAYRDLIDRIRKNNGNNNKPVIKPEDKYEPEFSLEDDDSNDFKQSKLDNRDSHAYKREQASSQSDEESESKRERRKRKKSRWGDDPPVEIKPPGIAMPQGLPMGPTAPLPPLMPGMKLAKVDGDGLKLTNVNRNNPALMQYAMTNYGTTNLSPENWKKCEDNFKLNLLFQDMLKKRQEVERLAQAGKHKYEYDSDEDTAEGTWEHKLRLKEMSATEKWATELTKQAEGKHHIGDFLPPEELKKFMEKYSAVKMGKEPDLSDYKEYKLKEDNVGFKMLQKLGWSEGQGLGAEGTGIVDPINKANQPVANLGLGAATSDAVSPNDDEFDAYRKRMMLAYRFRPNPLNNPRRPYY